MSGLITFVWLSQSLILFVASLAYFFVPEWFLGVFWGGPVAEGGLALSLTNNQARMPTTRV